MNNIKQIILNTIIEHNMLNNVKNIIVACSGGADSIALLHVLNSMKQQLNVNVQAAHLNHNVRGMASQKDALAVKHFCGEHNIFLHEKTVNWQNEDAADKSENNLRNIRYEFFEQLIQGNEHSVLATAHNKNDNAETLLFNLTRGAGLNGACGIPFCRGKIVRPLLNVQRSDIEEYLQAHKISYCTDESNFSLEYSRNKIRHSVLPQLLSINPDAINALSKFISAANIDCEFIKIEADKMQKACEIENCAKEKGYDAKMLKTLHSAILTRICYNLISQYTDADEKKINILKDAIINSKGALELNKNVTISVSQGFVRVINQTQNFCGQTQQTQINETGEATNNWRITLEGLNNSNNITLLDGELLYIKITNCEKTVNFKKHNKNHLKNIADYGKIEKNAVFRTINAGDKFCAMFSNCTKTLKKVYSEHKYSLNLRQTNPVLASGNDILWAKGLGFANSLIADENTKTVCEIIIKSAEVTNEL